MANKTIKRWGFRCGRYFQRTYLKPKNIFGILITGVASSFILLSMPTPQNIYTTDLLNLIAKVESNSNYNAYFGNSKNTSIKFTSMTVAEVIAWQKEFIRQGNASSAVGRYQFIDSTLQGLIRDLGIDQSATFDEALQDRLAYALLERRGIREYVDKKISSEVFAHNLSKEWAGLPKGTGENPEQSYYAGDGLNKALISVDEVYASIATVRKL